ncbi:hypothetical protein QMO14_17035 [Variovorax sp. CAN2819]|uniref:hypothetical protein n=1 Tax=Variovorax sp. CAN15 TaxID=3046727 RepID=UPI0026484A0E|nr:hypothetical protein [Variovorax sp. CAN15]MDN6885313.1 hypothetical protein [Variovorax sp. CAN15]
MSDTQLQIMLRAIHDLAAANSDGASYSQIEAATGIETHLLMGKASHLKARGLIERANPTASRREIARFVPTEKGRAALFPPDDDFIPAETSVQRAIRMRPELATAWAGA